MEIKVIGESSSNRTKLLKNINRVVKNINEFVEITILDEKDDFNQYKIINTPGLVINDKTISQGKVLTTDEIIDYIQALAYRREGDKYE